MKVKMKDILPATVLNKLPLSFQKMEPLDRRYSVFTDRMVRIKKYQAEQCNVYPHYKPVSKII